MKTGLIFDIKHYCINDGPGIRVTVFFKGCPLRCAWCHNPESISGTIEKMYSKDKCIACSACVEVCPEQACTLTSGGVITDRKRCTGCGKCADICPTKATEMSGRIVTLDEVVAIVEKERIFFDQSGGGVTFSGGEPLYQPDFLRALLEEFGRRAIHRTVDTSGFVKEETLLEVAQHTDHFLYDLKIMDADRHRRWTGVDNHLIHSNLKALARTGASINIRIPVVKSVNDDDENISRTAAFVAQLPGEKKEVNILPYHNIMAGKHGKLGSIFAAGTMAEPSQSELRGMVRKFTDHGLHAVVGG